MTLRDAVEGEEYIISELNTDDEDLNSFLFSLGCYQGEKISVVFRKKRNYIVSIKGVRYSIDSRLADTIFI